MNRNAKMNIAYALERARIAARSGDVKLAYALTSCAERIAKDAQLAATAILSARMRVQDSDDKRLAPTVRMARSA